MKPIEQMSNEELADLVEYVSGYQEPNRKTWIDLKRAIPVLRGEASFPDGFAFFSRTEASSLFNDGFLMALYGELINRLQPPSIDLTQDEAAVLESFAVTRNVPRVRCADGRIRAKLYDIGFIAKPTYDPSGNELTDLGVGYCNSPRADRTASSSPRP